MNINNVQVSISQEKADYYKDFFSKRGMLALIGREKEKIHANTIYRLIERKCAKKQIIDTIDDFIKDFEKAMQA